MSRARFLIALCGVLYVAGVGVAVAGQAGQAGQAAQPARPAPPPIREGAKVAFDNDFITIWDITWSNQPWTHTPAKDSVVIFMEDGPIQSKATGANAVPEHVKPGQVMFLKAGEARDMGQSTAAAGQGARRAYVTELKDLPASMLDAKVPLKKHPVPNVFPRTGATKILENDRVIAWDVTWSEEPHMHVHYMHNFFSFLVDGPMVSTSIDGKKNVSEHTAVGRVGFQNAGAGPHMEQSTAAPGQPHRRAIFVQLKHTEVREGQSQ